ncbi:hypothetical protein AB0H76_15035 [Nocardia sp. NPDC050712]|uniref:hypothetical protein n=1 Tax=Nocardia sp. NPDC050712 TaxID=3155518 RepID=UPI0033DAB6DE
MSNHWDLRCLTCETDCDLGWNHGGDTIQQLIPHLAALAAAEPALDLLSDYAYDLQYPQGLLLFAQQHHSHDLIAVDEYGSLHGDCARGYPCSCCGHRQSCRKPRGHEGDCGPKDGAA